MRGRQRVSWLLGIVVAVGCTAPARTSPEPAPLSRAHLDTVEALMPLVDSVALELRWEPFERGTATRVFTVDPVGLRPFRVWVSVEPMASGDIRVLAALSASTRAGYSPRQDRAIRLFQQEFHERALRAEGRR